MIDARDKAIGLGLAALAMAGCAGYKPMPRDPAAVAASYGARTLSLEAARAATQVDTEE